MGHILIDALTLVVILANVVKTVVQKVEAATKQGAHMNIVQVLQLVG